MRQGQVWHENMETSHISHVGRRLFGARNVYVTDATEQSLHM